MLRFFVEVQNHRGESSFGRTLTAWESETKRGDLFLGAFGVVPVPRVRPSACCIIVENEFRKTLLEIYIKRLLHKKNLAMKFTTRMLYYH